MADNPLSGFKKLPTWGKIAVGVGGIGVVYFAYKQHQASAQNASSSTNSSAIDPLTGMPYSQDNTVDPATGMTYLAEAQQYGSVSAAESAYSSGLTGSYYGGGYPSAGYTGGSFSGYLGNNTVSETYTTNAQWAQAVESGLTNIGYSSTDVAGAIGYYLAGVPLTATQATIVYDALAEYGEPPQGAPAIQVTSGSSTASSGSTGNNSGSSSSSGNSSSSSGSGSSSSSSGNNNSGWGNSGSSSGNSGSGSPNPPQNVPHAPWTSPPNIYGHANGSEVVVTWGTVGSATAYRIQINKPNGGIWYDKWTSGTSAVFDIAPMRGTYRFKVLAANPAGEGPWSAWKSVTVTQ